MIAATNPIPYNYSLLNPYVLSPLQSVNKGPAGGKTLPTIMIIIASAILIGMALGLGLGIAAVGAVTDGILIPVVNLTQNTSRVNITSTIAPTTLLRLR